MRDDEPEVQIAVAPQLLAMMAAKKRYEEALAALEAAYKKAYGIPADANTTKAEWWTYRNIGYRGPYILASNKERPRWRVDKVVRFGWRRICP